MKIICGLGNPGKKYENTRHNAGYLAVTEFAKKINAPEFKNKPKWAAEISEVKNPDLGELVLLKPQTFMNLSGKAVVVVANYFKVSPENIFILTDDIDLPLGTIRLRESGGPGTHNGMKSLVEHLGTENFPRLRIGIESRGLIDAAPPKEADLHDFVLGNFTPMEKPKFQEAVGRASEALIIALKEGIKATAEKFN